MPKNPISYYIGLGALVLSLTWFLLIIYSPIMETRFIDELGAFFVNYGITFLYFVGIFINHVRKHGWKKFHKGDEHSYSIALVLFSISAHSLNFSEIKLFSPYVDWMIAYVVFMHVTVLLFPFRELLPANMRFILHFINGAGLVLATYLTIFLLPILVFCIPAGIFFGISLHAMVPFWFALYYIQAWLRMDKRQINKRAYWMGALIPLVIFSVFLGRWHSIQKEITEAREHYAVLENKDFPEWVYLASAIPSDLLTQKIMMASGRTQRMYWSDFGLMDLSGSDFTRHDPLALAAIALYGGIDMNPREMNLLFEAQYDCRHMTHRRLWSGNQLMTKNVKSEIDIYPEYRLAYEQMTLTIHHENRRDANRWSNQQQEAVYSFYLPEGSIATSLSLWIDGVEEKSRLTTKSKADSAYRTIVGRERRDPALMHWQEGNRVSVTVFPCSPDEDRIFKVGFTTPLQLEEDKLSLRHVSFRGPATWKANADITVRFPTQSVLPQKLNLPRFWKKADKEIRYHDLYQPDWVLSFEAPELNTQSVFEWKDASYRLSEALLEKETWQADQIVLDVNAEWNWGRYKQIWEKVKEREVFVYTPEKIRLSEENFQEVFHLLNKRSFSLLPLYAFEHEKKTLVISLSNGHGPLLKDLNKTPFSEKTTSYFSKSKADIRWFSLGQDLPPYVKTLKELAVLKVHSGKFRQLSEVLEEGHFPVIQESANSQHIPLTGINIVKDTTTSSGGLDAGAPDHLFRLFAYQDLMEGIGGQYFDSKKMESEWVKKAESAYILSPVSSLIVLETQKDYERFDIKKNKDTVGNATIDKAIQNADGSVPEPHEWVLIICFLSLLSFIGWKKWWLKQ